MADKLFRCEAEGCEAGIFEAPKGVCPGCKASAAEGEPVIELMPVHYITPDKSGPIKTKLGRRSIACDPKSAKLPQSSGDRDAVTCPKCRASGVFTQHEDAGTSNHDPMIEKIAANKLGS